MSTTDTILTPGSPDRNEICFKIEGQDVLIINKGGLFYKGEHAKDAGEAYEAFTKTMAAIEVVTKGDE